MPLKDIRDVLLGDVDWEVTEVKMQPAYLHAYRIAGRLLFEWQGRESAC